MFKVVRCQNVRVQLPKDRPWDLEQDPSTSEEALPGLHLQEESHSSMLDDHMNIS